MGDYQSHDEELNNNITSVNNKAPEPNSVNKPLALQKTNDHSQIKPIYIPCDSSESISVQSTIDSLSLIKHVEGGYFIVTDVSNSFNPSPYPVTPLSQTSIDLVGGLRPDFNPLLRCASSTIFYYLTPNRPQGSFHRNRSRIMHTLHRGRGRYVLIHTDGRVETFVVGPNISKGEKLQWVVEGEVWKASFLLEAETGGQGDNEGLLITETVIPGFEYADHEFLSHQHLRDIVSTEKVAELEWLVKHDMQA